MEEKKGTGGEMTFATMLCPLIPFLLDVVNMLRPSPSAEDVVEEGKLGDGKDWRKARKRLRS
jgi:hypothetical protein